METLALAVGGGASGFHDEPAQGPSGGRSAALFTVGGGVGRGAAVQAAIGKRRTRTA
jgi:hypothetical protein